MTIESYIAIGDGLSLDPLLAEAPSTPGPASLLARELAVNHQLGKFKNLAQERREMGSVWINQLPSILASRGESVVTITTGLENLVNLGLELPYTGQIHTECHELVSGYRRLVKTLKRLLPNALIIGTTLPDPTLGSRFMPVHQTPFPSTAVLLFNTLLHEINIDGFVIADVYDDLDREESWSSRQNLQLSADGCARIASHWLAQVERAGLISRKAVA